MRKTLLSILTGILTVASAMADTVVITINLSTKKVTIADTISIRETVPVQIVNIGGSEAANLTLRILDNEGAVYAQKVGFSDAGSDIAYGSIDLNTQELVAYFADAALQSKRAFTLGLWDTSLNRLLVNTIITIQNNPYSSGMPGPSPLGVTYMVVGTYDANSNGVVDTSDALTNLLANPPWQVAATNDAVQSGTAVNAGSNTWVDFTYAYTGDVAVVASPSDDFTYEATIRVREPVSTTGFYFSVSSAAGCVTNAWKVFWVASPKSATGAGVGSVTSYTDADAVAAVSNVLGTAAWKNWGIADDTNLPTYGQVKGYVGAFGAVTSVILKSPGKEWMYDGFGTEPSAGITNGALTLRMYPTPYPGYGLGYYYTPDAPGEPWRLSLGIPTGGVTGGMILNETIGLADIADATEADIIARAGDVELASNNTYSAGTTQYFKGADAETITARLATINTGVFSRVEVSTTNIVTSPSFADDTQWTFNASYWTLGAGALFSASTILPISTLSQDVGAVAGRTYTVTYTATATGVGYQFRCGVGGVNGTWRYASGTYSETMTATSTGALIFTAKTVAATPVTILVSSITVTDDNSDISIHDGIVDIGGRTITWEKIATWDAGAVGTSTNSTHLGGVAAALYSTDAERAAAISSHNASSGVHTAAFALKQDASTAATDAELTAHNTNATAHATAMALKQDASTAATDAEVTAAIASHNTNASVHATVLAAKQPLDADLTKLATNNGGSLTNLQPFRTAWKLAYGNGTMQWTELPFGTAGQYLRSAGPSSVPSWYTPTFTAISTNVGLANLTNVVGVSEFAVGDGTNFVVKSLANTKTVLGLGWENGGASNEVVVYNGTVWTNEAFLALMSRAVTVGGGWYSLGIDAQTIDGLDSSAFLVAASGIDDISDVSVAGAVPGNLLAFWGGVWVPTNSVVNTNALDALWTADIAAATSAVAVTIAGDISTATGAVYAAAVAADGVATGALHSTIAGEITAATGAVYAAAVAADGVATGALYATVSGDITTATGAVYAAAVANYAAADVVVSNAVMGAFYTGYTNLLQGYQAGDVAVSNAFLAADSAAAATVVRKDGTVAMTGNLNMGGHSITNIAASSLVFAGGATVSAAKVATWDAGSLSDTAVSNLVAAKAAKAGDLTQFTALGGTSGQVFKSNGSGGGAWADDSTTAGTPTIVQAFGGTDQLITEIRPSWENITWSESIDTAGCFGSDTFTAPATAYYRISVAIPQRMVSGVNEATEAMIRILKNGTTTLLSDIQHYRDIDVYGAYHIYGQGVLSCVVYLALSDTIVVQACKTATSWYVDHNTGYGQAVKASLSIEKL